MLNTATTFKLFDKTVRVRSGSVFSNFHGSVSVSYTHLTLPTSDLV